MLERSKPGQLLADVKRKYKISLRRNFKDRRDARGRVYFSTPPPGKR